MNDHDHDHDHDHDPDRNDLAATEGQVQRNQGQLQDQDQVQQHQVQDRPPFAEAISHQTHHPTFTGSTLADNEGRSVGKIDDVVFDTDSTQPTWLVVNPGLLRAERFVPVRGATWIDEDTVAVPYPHDKLTSAPKAGRDHVVDRETRSELVTHYQLAGGG